MEPSGQPIVPQQNPQPGAGSSEATPLTQPGQGPHSLSPLPLSANTKGPHPLSPLPASASGNPSGSAQAFEWSAPFSIPAQDLSQDSLLLSAPRMEVRGNSVPTLGGIPLMAKLGQGGMGSVYYGIHPRLQKEVAVKVLPLHLARQQPDLIQRFYREARIAARVQSPHLVGVLDVNQDGPLVYLVMEYVYGISAGGYLKHLKQTGRMGLEEVVALEICIATCRGLAAAHAQGIVHRDVKPDNVLLPRTKPADELLFQAAKLADLGLARGEDLNLNLTVTRTSMGTPGYMAPEQALDAKTAGPPADIFSLGALLYGLLSGNAPFKGPTITKVLFDTVQTPHEPIGIARPDISAATASVLDRCLQKDPRQRFGNASELLEALLACRNSMPLPTPTLLMPGISGTRAASGSAPVPMTPAAPFQAPTPWAAAPSASPLPVAATKIRQGRGVLVAMLLLLLLAGGGAGAWFWREHEIAQDLAGALVEAEFKAKDASKLEEAITLLDRTAARYPERSERELAPLRELKAALSERRDQQALVGTLAKARELAQDPGRLAEALGILDGLEHLYSGRPVSFLSEARALKRELEHRRREQQLAELRKEAEEKARAPEGLEAAISLLKDLRSQFKDLAGPGLEDALGRLAELERTRAQLEERRGRFQSLLNTAQSLLSTDPSAALGKLEEAERVGQAHAVLGQPDLLSSCTPTLAVRRAEVQAVLQKQREAHAAQEKLTSEAGILKAFQAGYEEAQTAVNAGQVERAEMLLKNALSLLGALDHPLKPFAVKQLKPLQEEAQKRSAFAEALKKAEEFLAARNYTAAQPAFEEARKIWPLSPEIGRVEKGQEAVRQALANQALQERLATAQRQLQQHQWKEAQAAFEAILAGEPRNEEAQRGLAQVHYEREMEQARNEVRQARWREAQAAFERALVQKPRDPAALQGLQDSSRGDKDVLYQSALAEGVKALEQAQWAQSMAFFVRALEHRPQDSLAQLGLAAAKGTELKHSAKADWPDSGVRVQKGDRIHFVASGHWLMAVNLFVGPAQGWPQPDGRTAFFRLVNQDAEGHKFFAETLIGRIGEGDPFYVGKGRDLEATAEGMLKFRMNEAGTLGGLRDNGGELSVSVHLIPASLRAAAARAVAAPAVAPVVPVPAVPVPETPVQPAPIPIIAKEAANAGAQGFGPAEVLGTFAVYANLPSQGVPLDKNGRVLPLATDLDKDQYAEALKARKSLLVVEKGTRVRVEASGKWFSGPGGAWVTPDGRHDDGHESLKNFRAFRGSNNELNIAMLVVYVCEKEKPVTEDFNRIAEAGQVWVYRREPIEFVMPVTGTLRFQQNRDGNYDVTQGAVSVTVSVSKAAGK